MRTLARTRSPFGLLAALVALVLGCVICAAAPARAETPDVEAETAQEQTAQSLAILGNKVTQIDTGNNHCAAICADGSLWMWGANGSGQIGDGTYTERHLPTKVMDDVKLVALGEDSSAAVKRDGTLWMWGDNTYGQLGNGTWRASATPQRVPGLSNVTAIALGGENAAAVTSGGTLYTWGRNREGQLGLGTTRDFATPQVVEGLPPIATVSMNGGSTGVVTTSGELYFWGNAAVMLNYYDGPENDGTLPIRIDGLGRVTSIDFGGIYGALNSSGDLYIWGSNEGGQLATGKASHGYAAMPKRLNGLSRVVDASMGGTYCAAVTSDGSLYTWGSGGHFDRGGLLGDGTAGNRYTPGRVWGIPTISKVSFSRTAALALTTDGVLYTWGINDHGQLGDGSTANHYSPQSIYFPVTVPVSSNPSVAYIYRVVNPSNNKHLFTASSSEANSLQLAGWRYEGVAWNAPKTSDTPVYRLYNHWTGEHLYTTNQGEYRSLCAGGWTGENTAFYASDKTGTPVYRLFNPWAPGASAHHYTTSETEYRTLVSAGYRGEGIAWYGLK